MNEMFSRITNKMQEKNITQRELTKKLNMTETNFGQWKRGKNESYKKYLPEIARILGVTVDYLLTGENEQTEAERYYKAILQATDRDRKIIDILLGFSGSESVTTPKGP